MYPAERAALDARFFELEAQLQNLYAGKVVDGDPALLERKILEEQDEIG